MHTIMALAAMVAGLSATNVPSAPSWLDDYGAALKAVSAANKPMAVFVGGGKDGWQKVVRDGGVDPTTTRLLAQKFVCVYVDTETANGRSLASAFQVGSHGLIISDKTGAAQAFSLSGTLTRQELRETIAKYSAPADGKVATESVVRETPIAKPATPSLGQAPAFALADISGKEWSLKKATGRLVLLDFWGTHCGPCMRTVPTVNRLHTDHGANGLEVVALACEGHAPFAERARTVEEVARRKDMKYGVFLERENHSGEIQHAFGVYFVPTFILLDRTGNILFRGGGSDGDLSRLEQVIRENLATK